MMKFLSALFPLAAALCACQATPAPVTPPPDADCDAAAPLDSAKCPPCRCADAGPAPAPPPAADIAAAACQNLRAIRCSDGDAPDCAATLRVVQASGKFRIDPAKLAGARTLAEARAAGAACQ